ncbi:hypothetical protein WJX79_007755 [Trebouxia sp. C0005]
MILPAWPDHTSKKSERCSSTGQILAVHKNVQLHRKKAKELGLQNSEYITFPNWAAQRPKQQLCRRPQEAQPMSDLCQAILQACRAAGSSEEATVLCLVKTSQWAYAHLTGTSHVTAPLQQQHGTIHSMEANTDSSVGAKAAFPESCFAGPTSQPFTLQPVGGKPIVDVVIDAVGNPAEPYMLRVVNSAAESTMDLHASVLVKVAPESIPEVKAFMQHVSAIMSRAQNGDDSAILQMHQMCKVCKDEGILCNQLPQSLAQPHANSAATIEVQLDEETHWRELQQSQPPVAMEWELLSLEELNTCYSAPTEQRNRFQGSASGCTKGMSRARISMHGNCVPMLGACAGFGLSPVLIMVCLLALPIVVMCLRLCSAQPRGRLQVQTDCGCTIM